MGPGGGGGGTSCDYIACFILYVSLIVGGGVFN